jgi:hypothetical protein
MLDDLRNSVTSEYAESELPSEIEQSEKPKKVHGAFLGMTASQRFIVALLLFLMVAILGVFLLVIFEKVYPPL